MNIGSIGSNPLLSLNFQQRTNQTPADAMQILPPRQANSAAQTILPPNSATQLSFETLLSLQSLDQPALEEVQAPTPTQIFLQEAQKSPMERMREQILEQLGLTEDAIDQMPPEERRAVEDQIREMIEQKLREGMGADREAPDSNASMIEAVA